MADDFRKLQRCQIGDAVPNRRGFRKWGCPCCNPAPLNKLRKITRRKAKVLLRREDEKLIKETQCQ